MDGDEDFYSGNEFADNDSDYADSVDADYEFVEDDVDDSDDLLFRRRQVCSSSSSRSRFQPQTISFW